MFNLHTTFTDTAVNANFGRGPSARHNERNAGLTTEVLNYE